MESWFLADRDALASFYGRRFNKNKLPGSANIEEVSKQDIFRALENATRSTQKGKYSKGSHSFDVLGTLNAGCVEDASRYAKRFLNTLRGGGPA